MKKIIYSTIFAFAILIAEPLLATFDFRTTINPDDAIIIDSETGLIWQKYHGKNISFNNADLYCSVLYYAGFSDWRLPTKDELAALIKSKSFFPYEFTGTFWSSSYVDKSGRYIADFHVNDVRIEHVDVNNSFAKENSFHDVICVREPISDSDKTLSQSAGYQKTGNLQWSKIAPSTTQTRGRTHEDAMKYCQNLIEIGRKDWRLPSIDELKTLISTENLNIGPDHFGFKRTPVYSKLGKAERLWSSSIKGDSALYVDFTRNSNNVKEDFSSQYHDVRCVRTFSKSADKKEATKIDNLFWSKGSIIAMTSKNAIDYCKNLNEDGHNDWRLPNIDELRTLIQNHSGTETGGTCEISEKSGKLAKKDFTKECRAKKFGGNYSKLGDRGLPFWSSSTLSDNPNDTWTINFSTGGLGWCNNNKLLLFRCVR